MGAFNYSPTKSGAENGQIVEVILDSLLEADGTAFTKEVDSFVWAERNAEARALAYLWSLNTRFANQWDPLKMTDFLPRWEKMLGLSPLDTDTLLDRRLKVKVKLESFGEPGTQQVVEDILQVVLGDVFVDVVNTPSTVAVGFVPGGVTIPGGVTLPDGSWYSTIAYLAIETNKPLAMDDATFYDAVGQIASFLDDLLPVWVTFDWFLDGVHGAGFYLDEEKNLNNQRFSE